MSEIKNSPEIVEMDRPKQEVGGFRNIKPEGSLSFPEAQKYWDDLFEKSDSIDANRNLMFFREIKDGEAHYYDDNNNLYRHNKELLPDTQYELNQYVYQTDCLGRIISVEGKLHLKEREGRLYIRDTMEDIGKGDQREGDDRGHIIGDQFDGVNGLENMIPQDADINRNAYKNLENELAREVKSGKEVYVAIEPIYEGTSRRPTSIAVTYSIDGNTNIRIFQNGKGE